MILKIPAATPAEKARRRKERQEQVQKQRQEQVRKQRQIEKQQRRQQRQQAMRQQQVDSRPVPNAPTQDPTPYNHAAYVVAGGPSLTGFDWSLLDDKFTVGINRAYEVLPNADVIYFTDEDYYKRHIDAMKKHTGRLIKGCINFGTSYDPRVERFKLTGLAGLDMTPGCLRHGRNSTYAVINMLVQWGFKHIYLLGVDMKWGKTGDKKTTHWHNGHARIDAEGAYQGFIKNFEGLVPLLKQHNVEVINVNNNTNLKAFPIKTYQDIFGQNCFRKETVDK